jgi:hypothetical protein
MKKTRGKVLSCSFMNEQLAFFMMNGMRQFSADPLPEREARLQTAGSDCP